MTQPAPAVEPLAALSRLIHGAHLTSAVACAAKLGIPDLLKSGPQTATELAGQINANPQSLYRLMRTTASVGVFSEGSDGKFTQTPVSELLTKDGSPTLRALMLMYQREWHNRAWENLDYCVQTGKPAIEKVYGTPIFGYLQQRPEEAEIFNEAMTSISMLDAPAVAEAYSFDGIGEIVDVGGGHGLLLATILARNPKLRGTLYDLPHVVQGAEEGPLAAVKDRCTLERGDMFESVPAGADAYIMKHIIHDWPDAECGRILKACRKGAKPHTKLLIVDCVIQPGNDFAPGKILDLLMMIFPGGRERSESEFRELLAASGWRLNRVIPTAAPDSIVEAVPA